MPTSVFLRRLSLALLALASTLAAGACDAGVASGPASASAPGGAGGVAVTGAVNVTFTTMSSCSASGSVVAAVYEAVTRDAVYILQISSDHVDKKGEMPIGKAVSTKVIVSDAAGNSWESVAEGSSGHITVGADLRSGTVDVSLVNPTTGTRVQVAGDWSCAVGQ